ncbi:DUF1367 family protein [Tateyamaria sp.]|uniref:DUF1367 family protein n=1 Tax=Tateyamaria sp. TaxID=1929288 RepID=UPI003B212D27
MADIHLIKSAAGLVPSDAMAAEWFAKVPLGKPVNAKVTLPRNGKFHRKFFAMLNVAYDNHDWPDVQSQFGPVKTSFEMFREYATVKAGHYEMDMTPRGDIRARAKSVSWAKMDDEEFQRLYSDVLDVILAEFLSNWTAGDMENAVNVMLGFAK